MRKFFIACLLATITLSADITISCDADSACPQGFAFKYTDQSGATAQSCTSACNTNYQVSVSVLKCSSDINGDSCSSGVCLLPKDFDICSPTVSCSSETIITVECGECKSSSCEGGVCLWYQYKEVCAESDQCLFQSATIREKNCTQDTMGYLCSCCDTYFIQGARTGLCSSLFAFDSDQLSNYATESSEPALFTKLSVFFIALIVTMLQ